MTSDAYFGRKVLLTGAVAVLEVLNEWYAQSAHTWE